MQSSLAVRKLRRRPDPFYHMMYTADVFQSHTTSSCCRDKHKWSWKSLKQVTRVQYSLENTLMGDSGSSKQGVGACIFESGDKNTPTSHAVSLALFYVLMQ